MIDTRPSYSARCLNYFGHECVYRPIISGIAHGAILSLFNGSFRHGFIHGATYRFSCSILRAPFAHVYPELTSSGSFGIRLTTGTAGAIVANKTSNYVCAQLLSDSFPEFSECSLTRSFVLVSVLGTELVMPAIFAIFGLTIGSGAFLAWFFSGR